MRAYIIRRSILMIPTIFLVTIIVFGTIRFIPGNVIDLMVAEMVTESGLGEELTAEYLREVLGMNVPIHIQYLTWLGVHPQREGGFSGVIHGDLGTTLWTMRPVTEEIFQRLPVSAELGILAIMSGLILALPIGIVSALRQNSWADYIGRSFAIFCIAVPAFWIGTMVIVFPSIWWGYMPPIMHTRFIEDPIGNLRMFVIPGIVLGMTMAGATMRMTRTMMLEELRQDYIRTAWSKGLRERVVVVRHALKNALIPVVTLMGLQVPILMGGTVIIEQIFSLPGMGRLVLSATVHRDEALIGGLMFIFAGVLVLVNLMVDLTYAYLDPRVRYK